MYQSQVRPETGRELAELHRPRRDSRSSRVDRSAIDLTVSFLQSFPITSNLARIGALVLVTGCVVSVLSGCGGLTGTITKGKLSQVSCGTQSLTGAQTKACSVNLSAAVKSPTTVKLASSNAALNVPVSVVVAKGSTSTEFNVVASSVNQSTNVTITGQAGGITMTDVITLYPVAASLPTLSSVSCGTQTLTGPTTEACSVNLSAAAPSPMTVSLSSSNSALQVPAAVTVAAGATSTGFNATASAITTAETVTLTALADGVSQTAVIQLQGAGGSVSTQHQVLLTWDAPNASSDPIVGYKVYRAAGVGSSYAPLSSSVDTQTAYTDATVQSGLTYDYMVTSVDSNGVESLPSNSTVVTVP